MYSSNVLGIGSGQVTANNLRNANDISNLPQNPAKILLIYVYKS